jgi:hypothetical protein
MTARVVDQILEPAGASGREAELLTRLEVLSDPRIERYWQLTATINGWPPFPSRMPALEWLIAALRARDGEGRQSGSRRRLSRQNSLPSGSARTCQDASAG